MLSLYEPLRSEYEYGDRTYKIDLAFDNVLRFYKLLDDKEFSYEEIV